MRPLGILRHGSALHFWRYSVAFQRKLHAETTGKVSFYDIIIAGGGMVGTTLACKLAHNSKLANKKILLLEGAPEREWSLQLQYSNRVSALNKKTKDLLVSIGAWKHIVEARYKPVKKMQVWEALSDSMITFYHDNMIQDVAFIVENDVLLAAVNTVLESAKNVTVLHKARVKNYQLPGKNSTSVENDELVYLELENGSKFACSLVIGADGANSQVRKAMGVQYLSWNYNQMGIVATVRLFEPTENVVAWQRFLPTGPVALLPLTDELSSLVWSIPNEQAQNLLKLSEECFVDALNEALWKQYPRIKAVDASTRFLDSILGSILLVSNAVRQLPPSVTGVIEGSRAAFPLGFGHSTCYVAKGVALVGDAAHRIHPLAGQGVNLGFGDICCLSEMLSEAVGEGKALGSLSHLHQYETLRQRHNVPIMLAVDGLQKLYSSEVTPVVMLRSLGLQFTHALNPVKNFFMNYAAV
ncbi:ubiquinone biosynthesis monooxygenase COQ6, mitochondrial [Anabrus simplex]|uniref:ubiquinone biosynthesis monooxygenase COQ6, mitochondrial n=1 Tax=Anabrus simplex TaxID=316456 RepID=UPI0035A2EE80